MSITRSFIFICALTIFSPNGVLAGGVTIPNTFSAGATAVADDVNENFTVIGTAVNDNDARILDGNRISNGNFSGGLSGWTQDAILSTGVLELATDATAPAGDSVVQNSANAVVWGTSETWIPVNQNRTYRVMGAFKRVNVGSVGTLYLAVRLRDAAGVEITGDGSWWFYPVSAATPTTDVWTAYSGEFGAGTAKPFPADAREATIAFILNHDAGVGGNSIYQVQGLGIFEAQPPTAWKNLTLINNATVYGGAYQVPQYRKVGDEVCLRGLVNSVTVNQTTIATLPTGHAPPARLLFLQGGDRTDVDNSGNIIANSNDSVAWMSLDGICFSTTP